MDIIKVVCGIIFKDEKVLICKRMAEKSLGGYWEFPGGKVEVNETNEDSLKRELKEELDMIVAVESFFVSSFHSYDHLSIELVAYTCKFISSSFKLSDHDQYEWVQPNELLNWKLAPADVPIVEELLKSISKKPE